jgi:hypothetical protein
MRRRRSGFPSFGIEFSPAAPMVPPGKGNARSRFTGGELG